MKHDKIVFLKLDSPFSSPTTYFPEFGNRFWKRRIPEMGRAMLVLFVACLNKPQEAGCREPLLQLGPPVVPLYPFVRESSPTEI